ncbi:MAG TPA: carboxypeptidase-like regulatory domain-containing protein [Pyrinomonadaceae bacterium]|jgi:hypothetical protein
MNDPPTGTAPAKLKTFVLKVNTGPESDSTDVNGYVSWDTFPAGDWKYYVLLGRAVRPFRQDPHPYIKVYGGGKENSYTVTIDVPDEARNLLTKGGQGMRLVFFRPARFEKTGPAARAAAGDARAWPQGQKAGQPDDRRSIVGRVLDSANQPVAGAECTVARLDKDDVIVLDTVVSSATGECALRLPRDKPAEEYIFSVERDGFYPQSVSVPWADSPPEVSLVPADEGSEREALAALSMEPAKRYVFSPMLMQSLPVPGFRSFDSFALLAPGVLPPPQTFNSFGPGIGPGVGTAGQFAINGLRSRENNFTVDGSDNNDEDIGTRRQGFVALTPQPIESLMELQVITALADARYGRNMGGQVNALTQSGSEDFHAALYGFYTDSRLNARDFFDQSDRGAPASYALTRQSDGAPVLLDGRPLVQANPVVRENPLRRAQAGFLLGGRAPRADIFYFGTLERKVNREARETHFAVPTVRQRGLFETGETGFRSGGSSFFPTTVPGDAVFSLYPFPNNPAGPYGANTYTAVLPADSDATLFTVKGSRQFGAFEGGKRRAWWKFAPVPIRGDVLTGRYNFTQDRSNIPAAGEAIFAALRPRVRTQNYAFFLDRHLSERLSDSIRFSFGRTRLFLLRERTDARALPSGILPDTPLLLNAPLLLNVTTTGAGGAPGAPSYVSASSAAGAALLGSLGYSSVTQTEQITGPLGQVLIPGFSPVGVDVSHFPQTRANNTIQVADTVRYVRGGHTPTLGADIRHTQINSTLDRNFRPFASFNGLRNAGAPLPLTGAGGAAVPQQLLSGATLAAAGAPTGLLQVLAVEPNSTLGLRFTQVNFFVQDEWQKTSRLRLTYGLRYEINTVPDTVGRRLERAFDPEELRANAQAAAAACGPRCNDLAPALTAAFPADFKVSFGSDRNDFDGRVGFAYDPGEPGKFVVRGGFGTYSGVFPGIVLSQSRNAFSDFLPLNLANFSPRLGSRTFLFNPSNPSIGQLSPALDIIRAGTLNTLRGTNPISLLASQLFDPSLSISRTSLGLGLVLPQGRLKTGYSMQYGLTAESQLGDYYLAASYVGTRGVKLMRLRTPDLGVNNSLVTFAGLGALAPGSAFPFVFGSELPPQDDLISNSFVIARTLFESSASSRYNSLQLELRKRYSDRVQLGSALTFSHSVDDASDFFDTAGAFALPQDAREVSEKAFSSFDVRWRSVTHFLYDIPWDVPFVGRGRGLGGWQVSGILTLQTGQPFTVNSAFDVNRDGNATDRLDRTDGLIAASGDDGVRLTLAPGVSPLSLLAPDGEAGSVGRNTFRAAGLANFDLAVTKHLNYGDRYRLFLRTEIFNLFNRTNFAIPERVLESPGFGRSVRTASPGRMVQFALKLSF